MWKKRRSVLTLQKVESAVKKEQCNLDRRWNLEGSFLGAGQYVRIFASALPLQVGRSQSSGHMINHPSISRIHAELIEHEGCLSVRDCGSRNGTFVNYQRIQQVTPLHAGDCVHFGSCEFRVVLDNETLDEYRSPDETWAIKEPGGPEFQTMLKSEAVRIKFQPILLLEGSTIFAFECLGRGNLPGAPTRPDDLFRMATRYGYARALSLLFRKIAFQQSEALPGHFRVFFNVHPEEIREPDRFISDLAEVKDRVPHMSLVAEISEGVTVETDVMCHIQKSLRELGYGVAYDDFGVGQARLVQLSECPPEYLKFDRSMISNIDTAPAKRQDMVKMLVDFATNLGVSSVAEGIETPGESETCRQMGFRCGQGYLFGRPQPAEKAFAL